MNKLVDRVDVNGEIIGRRVLTICDEPSLTKQSMRDECDVNGIMQRFERTGLIAHTSQREAYFADVSAVPDFAQAIAVVEKAENMFMSLPAQLRAKFGNDAANYVQFCANPANSDEMVKLGLAEPKKVEPVATPVVEVKV